MSIARLVGIASLSIASAVAAASAFAADEPNVTEIVVRFRDPAVTAIAPASPDSAQFDVIGRAMRTGIAQWSPTIDGGYRILLAPSLAFLAARDAVNRLRMDASVLYVNIGATDAPPAPRASADRGGRPEQPLHRIIVRYRDPQAVADAMADLPLDTARLDAVAALAGQPVAHERAMTWAGAQLLRLFQPLPVAEVEAIVQAMARDPDVLWAQPDYIDQINLTPNDTQYFQQWHYYEASGGARLPAAWDRTTGWSGVRVAVTDTGSLVGHPDVGSRYIGGYDFIIAASVVDPRDGDNRDANPADQGDWSAANECGAGSLASNSSWHGTHVSGTIGALSNNALGVAGVNWVGRIVPVRVLGKCGGFSSDIADGLAWASGAAVAGVPANPHPARVVNMSLSGRRANQACDGVYQTAITTALSNNAVVVVAAGNLNEETSFSTPANCNGVVTVAATGRNGQRASYSNFDLNDASGIQVEIAAPGGSFADDFTAVLSTLNSGTTVPASHNYVEYQGTSMAAPHVSGIVSLMLSLKPSLTPAQVTSILTSTARAFPSGTVRDCTSNINGTTAIIKYCGTGIVNADAALTNIMTTGGPAGGPLTLSSASLTSSQNPSASGQSVTFTSVVTGNAPAGIVTFMDDETAITGCEMVVLVGGSAQCTTSALPNGTRPIRAVYSGNASNTPDDSPTLAQVVGPVGPFPTTTTVVSSQSPAAQGASVTFTATVSGQAATPTGTMQFRQNTVIIVGCSAVALSGGSAQCTTSTLPIGSHPIDAQYSGDAVNLGSTGSMTQVITSATACAGFTDVDSTIVGASACQNVGWLKNRQITLGCTSATLYCPNNNVNRLQMAAFMNRLGTALTPIDLAIPSADAPVALSSPQVLCATTDFAVTSPNFPRRARMRGLANMYAPTASIDVMVEHVVSTDAGATWTAVPGSQASQAIYAGLIPVDDKTVVPAGGLDLAVGMTYRFGMRFTRTAGTGNANIYCANYVRIGNRNSATQPY